MDSTAPFEFLWNVALYADGDFHYLLATDPAAARVLHRHAAVEPAQPAAHGRAEIGVVADDEAVLKLELGDAAQTGAAVVVVLEQASPQFQRALDRRRIRQSRRLNTLLPRDTSYSGDSSRVVYSAALASCPRSGAAAAHAV